MDVSNTEILIEHSESISWIVLNRPENANALSAGLLEQFSNALEKLRHEGKSVIGIRGNGRGFCAGADLKQYAGQAVVDPIADVTRLNSNIARWLQIWDHPKPIIAAVHGYCMGVAAQLCVFADLTVVSENARIGEPALPIGGGYVAPTWVSLVGTKRAKEFSFLPGNRLDGRTAVEWGWANHWVPEDQLITFTEMLAARMAEISPEVLEGKKRSINRAAEAAGFRAAVQGVAEIDALLHLAPAVVAIRQRIESDGLKAVIKEFKGPSSVELALQARRAGSQ